VVRSQNETRQVEYSAFPRYVVDAKSATTMPPTRTRLYLVQHWQIHTDDAFPAAELRHSGIAAAALAHAPTSAPRRPVGSRLSLMLFVRNLFDIATTSARRRAALRGGIPDLPRTLSAEVRFAL